MAGERAALLLDPAADILFLRFAFVERSYEQTIFPESVLDDWGHEIASLALYQWVFENGDRFPRAEVFGFAPDGGDRQCFVRELDLTRGLACYAYVRSDLPLVEGSLVEAVLVFDSQSDVPRQISRPANVAAPLSRAKVAWWSTGVGDAKLIDLTSLFADRA